MRISITSAGRTVPLAFNDVSMKIYLSKVLKQASRETQMGQIITLASNVLSGLFRVPRFIKADMSSPAAQFVREAIAKNKVVIFSKSYCPYCTIAKETFQKINFPVLTLELEHRNDCNQIQAVLGEMTGATSVPRVFVDGKFIGGGTDVKKLYETGELQKLLA